MPPASRVQRLVQTADFERVLGAPQRARSPHFAMHFVADQPARRPAKASTTVPPAAEGAGASRLSTADAAAVAQAVDDSHHTGHWLGLVVPKRHARRAVTRTLLKRQIRAAMGEHAADLAPGLWVVRLRAPFDVRQFRSAASGVLREAARAELDRMMRAAASALR
ncbi:ribonuclease P protein component [Aquincola sp. MAHUQ-54]|uniref:Ribonuclease P protein component n=1 Tax=Aquincola agrisoli TaxID=3119538 RepID=A0AAW9QN19_9BURK